MATIDLMKALVEMTDDTQQLFLNWMNTLSEKDQNDLSVRTYFSNHIKGLEIYSDVGHLFKVENGKCVDHSNNITDFDVLEVSFTEIEQYNTKARYLIKHQSGLVTLKSGKQANVHDFINQFKYDDYDNVYDTFENYIRTHLNYHSYIKKPSGTVRFHDLKDLVVKSVNQDNFV